MIKKFLLISAGLILFIILPLIKWDGPSLVKAADQKICNGMFTITDEMIASGEMTGDEGCLYYKGSSSLSIEFESGESVLVDSVNRLIMLQPGVYRIAKVNDVDTVSTADLQVTRGILTEFNDSAFAYFDSGDGYDTTDSCQTDMLGYGYLKYAGSKYQVTLRQESDNSESKLSPGEISCLLAGQYKITGVKNAATGGSLAINKDVVIEVEAYYFLDSYELSDAQIDEALKSPAPLVVTPNQEPWCGGTQLQPGEGCFNYRPQTLLESDNESRPEIMVIDESGDNFYYLSFKDDVILPLGKKYDVYFTSDLLGEPVYSLTLTNGNRFGYFDIDENGEAVTNEPQKIKFNLILDWNTNASSSIFTGKPLIIRASFKNNSTGETTSQNLSVADWNNSSFYFSRAFELPPGNYTLTVERISGDQALKTLIRTIDIYSGMGELKLALVAGTGTDESAKEAKVLIKAQVAGSNIELQKGVTLIIDDITDWKAGTPKVYGQNVIRVYPSDGSSGADVMPFTNTDDMDFLQRNGYETTFNYFNYGAVDKLIVGRKYAFAAHDVSGRFENKGLDVVLSPEYVGTIIFDKYSSTYKPPVDEVKPPTSARPPGLSDQDIASSGKAYVTMQKPENNSHFNLGDIMTAEARLDNFLLQPGDNKKIHYKFIIDGEYSVSDCDKAHYTPASNQQTVACSIDLGGSALKDYVGSGNHDIEVRVWRYAENQPSNQSSGIESELYTNAGYFDFVDFRYGAQVWIETPTENTTYKLSEQHGKYAKFIAKLVDFEGDRHVIMYFDNYPVCDFSSRLEGAFWSPARDDLETQIIDKNQNDFSCDISFDDTKLGATARDHSLIVRAWRFDEPEGSRHEYKNDIQICLIGADGKGGEACAAAGGSSGAAVTVDAGKPGLLRGLSVNFWNKWGRRAKSQSIADVVQNVVGGLVAIAGTILVLMLTINGIMYLTNAGNEEGVAKAKKGMIYAIIGLVIILAAYAIMIYIVKALGIPLAAGGGIPFPEIKLR